MGGTSSCPSEKLQYPDKIIYIDKQSFKLHNIDEHKTESTYEIQKLSANHIDFTCLERCHTKIVSTSIGEIMLTLTRFDSFLAYAVFIDEDWKTQPEQFIIWDVKNRDGWPKIDDIFDEVVKQNQNKWLTNNQMKQLQNKKPDFIIELLTSEKCIVRTDTSLFTVSSWSPHIHINSVTYCKYDKILIVCLKNELKFRLDRWEKSDDRWIKKKDVVFTPVVNTKRIIEIDSIVCSRRYIFFGAVSENYDNHIGVFDKETLTECYWMPGAQPTLHDGYNMWLRKNLELLKGIEVIKKMAEEILGIILSYVD